MAEKKTRKRNEKKKVIVRQYISKDAVVVPLLEEEDHKEIIKTLQEHEQEALAIKKKFMGKKCIICGEKATHMIKGIPTESYCKTCGKEHFKYLNYLEKI